jgi:DNA-binding LacI/PurR family transcriptional regulator
MQGPAKYPSILGASDNPADIFPSDSATRRCEAYIRYMRSRDAFDPMLLASAGSWADAYDIEVDAFLDYWLNLASPPTAVFCANDSLAIALSRAAHRINVQIPNALSIIGVGNRAATEDVVPAITSVDIPVENSGREAMRLLLRMLSGKELKKDQLRIEIPVSRLVVRSSTGPAGRLHA